MKYTKELFLQHAAAAIDGKLERYCRGNGFWFPETELNSEADSELYRIRPEPKLRPWKPEEVSVGITVRKKGHPNCQSVILGKTQSGCVVIVTMVDGVGCKVETIVNERLFADFEQLDGKPCGAEEAS